MVFVVGIPNNLVTSSPSVQSNQLNFYLTVRDSFVYPAFPNRKWKSRSADMWKNGHQFHRGRGGKSNRWGMTTKQPLEPKEREGHAHQPVSIDYFVPKDAGVAALKGNFKMHVFGYEKNFLFPVPKPHKYSKILKIYKSFCI